MEEVYNSYSQWIRKQFPYRVQKISIDAGFSCPNRDGQVGRGGCIFCDNQTFNPSYCDRKKTIAQQLEEGKQFFGRKYPDMKYLAYFQAFSNTYAPIDVLRERYEAALSHPAVKGLVIGTRPDCIDTEKLDYLSSIKERGKIVEVEYGIESVYDLTLRRINRGHDFACTRRAVMETASRGLTTGGHIILGLPGETREMLLQEAEILSALPLDYLKFHQLQILKGTPMASEYKERPGDFLRPGPQEYIDLLAEMITRLRPDIAIARIASSVPPSFTDAPFA